MNGRTRLTAFLVSLTVAGAAYAASSGEKPVEPRGATGEVQPAPPPAQPTVPPAAGGFPAMAIPAAILIGLGVAAATNDNESAAFPAATTTGTTSTR